MRWKITLLILVYIPLLQAQSSYKLGLMPSINYTLHLKNNWKSNFKVESRPIFEEGIFGEVRNRDLHNQLIDFSALASKKVGLRATASGGYLIRFTNDQVIHRLSAEYSWINRFSSSWLAQRVLFDETFFKDFPNVFRARYRVSFQVPFKGKNIDEKEFYFKVNNEYLNILTESTYDLEFRLAPFVGYEFNSNNRLEFGIEWRTNTFTNKVSRHQFWFCISWFISNNNQ